jgi:hypothetical protein
MVMLHEDAREVRYFMEESIAFSVKGVITITLKFIVNLAIGDNLA